jgi:hypothetical protein
MAAVETDAETSLRLLVAAVALRAEAERTVERLETQIQELESGDTDIDDEALAAQLQNRHAALEQSAKALARAKRDENFQRKVFFATASAEFGTNSNADNAVCAFLTCILILIYK